ncbi:DUF302 domain-containing protein [Mycolicibacterium mucogenicum]|uniref:DUF302 domain-containing protein n=1 Tax=Mycolicibacterium mucogenicum TaxID=56689 RepID=UPI001A95A559|nr:DUF302 domain-containing protein [Mycolicibacterium mucogenicum]
MASTPTSASTASGANSAADTSVPAAETASMVTADSNADFAATIDALKAAVSSNGMMILGELDQAAALKATGLNLAGAHTFFVGNPSMGKMFFQMNPAIGTVVPLRILVWAGEDGKAHVSYFDPKPAFAAVDPKLAEGGQKMSDAAAMLTKAATGGAIGHPSAPQALTLKTVDAKGSFDDAINAVKSSASANGMMVLGELDQAGALKATGLNLAGAHTFFVGNPSMGKMFFQMNPAIGTVVPLALFIWAGDDGKTHVSYFDPAPMFAAVDPKLANGGQKMSQAAAMVAGSVA